MTCTLASLVERGLESLSRTVPKRGRSRCRESRGHLNQTQRDCFRRSRLMSNEAEIAQAAGNGLLDNQQKRPSKRDELALREEGRSLLPVSRVQRIIKADKASRIPNLRLRVRLMHCMSPGAPHCSKRSGVCHLDSNSTSQFNRTPATSYSIHKQPGGVYQANNNRVTTSSSTRK